MRTYALVIIILLLSFGKTETLQSQQSSSYDESLYHTMEWRLVGPFRRGRAGTVAGVTKNPNLYYMGTAGGGVWKTIDGGNTWECISDGFYEVL